MSLKLMQIEALSKSQAKIDVDKTESEEKDKAAAMMKASSVAWYDRYIIERTSTFFVLWNLVNTIVSIVSSFLYAYMCAFGLK